MSRKKQGKKKKITLESIWGTTVSPLTGKQISFIDEEFLIEKNRLRAYLEEMPSMEEGVRKISFTQQDRAKDATKKIIPFLLPLLKTNNTYYFNFLVHAMAGAGCFFFDLFTMEKSDTLLDETTALFFIDAFASSGNDEFFTMLDRFDLEDEEEVRVHTKSGFLFSGRQAGKLTSIIMRRKTDRKCRDFFSSTIALYGEENINGLLRDILDLYNGLFIALAAHDGKREAELVDIYERKLGEHPGKIVAQYLGSHFGGPPEDYQIPLNAPSPGMDRYEEAVGMMSEAYSDIPKTLFQLVQCKNDFPSQLSREECPADLKRDLVKCWKTLDFRRAMTALVLIDFLALPYKEFTILSLIIYRSLMGFQEDLISMDFRHDAEKMITPRFSIDKPLYKAEREYIDFLNSDSGGGSYKKYREGRTPLKPITLSFRQLFSFVAGDVALPTDLKVDSLLYKQLKNLGCDDKDATFLSIIWQINMSGMGRLGMIEEYTTEEQLEESFADIPEQEEEGKEEEEEENPDHLLKELQNCKEKLRDTERQLRTVNHERLEKERENANLRTRLEEQRKENAKLQETLFSFENEDEELEEEEDKSVAFPFKTERDVIVFGGRPNFTLNLRSFIPSLRFVTSTKADFTNLIRNADSIYLQTNAMSHSMYDMISETARKEQKEINYLKSSSSHRCAIQIALDLTREKEGAAP